MTSPEAGFDYDQLLSSLVDYMERLGTFDSVQTFELTGNIGQFVAAVWPQELDPYAAVSGLAATAVRLTFIIRIYLATSQQSPDVIDPRMVKAAATLMKAFNAGFTFGETVYGVDLTGQGPTRLSARAGYLKVGSPGSSADYRIMDIIVPVIITDVWPQAR